MPFYAAVPRGEIYEAHLADQVLVATTLGRAQFLARGRTAVAYRGTGFSSDPKFELGLRLWMQRLRRGHSIAYTERRRRHGMV